MKTTKSNIFLTIVSVVLCLIYISIIVLLGTYFRLQFVPRVIVLTLLGSLILLTIFLIFSSQKSIKHRREVIEKAYDFYVEDLITSTGVGVIIFNNDGEILWVSHFIEKRFNFSLIGQSLSAIGVEFEKKFQLGQENFRFEFLGIIYEAQINTFNRAIVLKDVTTEESLKQVYQNEKLVIGELEIDNFQQLQSILPEDEIFRVQSAIIKMLDHLVNSYNLIYRQYVNGKYILLTNEQTLEIFQKDNFQFLDLVRNTSILNGIQLTVSIGFGVGTNSQKGILELAKDGLLQAQSRGGDQVTVEYANLKPRYFGATTEMTTPSSRVKIKQITAIIEEKLKKPSIKNVIIYGHIDADLDAIGAAFGIYELVKNFDKPIYIQNKIYDNTVDKVINESLSNSEKEVFITPAKAQKISNNNTMVFIVDTAEINRIENNKALVKVKNNNVFVIDHHRASKLPTDIPLENIYIDTSASSTCEIVTEMLLFSRYAIKPSKTSVQMMMNGIYLDTKQFQKSVSSRTFEAASWLEKHGAQSQISSNILKIPSPYSMTINAILGQLKEVKEGYYIAAYDGEVPDDIISLTADEILRTQGRKAAFVIAKIPGKKIYKLSARGINTNVQTIAEQVGGGGHFGASAATSSEPLNVFVDNVVQAIVSQKGSQ